MSSRQRSSKTTSISTPYNNNALMRKLKIEEKILLQGLQILDNKINNEGSLLDKETLYDSDYKSTVKRSKDSYIHVKNLFDDLKTISSSQELLVEIDIEEIKGKVLELEKELNSIKKYLSAELNSLKHAEKEILKQMDEINSKESKMDKKRLMVPSASLKEIVPSPVRLLMTSPFKCSEVQDFQNFMKNSPNRYGGWIEYNHNTFVKYWQKHFGNSDDDKDSTLSETYVDQLAFENFVEEVSFKIQGVDKSSLLSHIEWYKTYIYLKERQQKAIDQWKASRSSVKKVIKTQKRQVNNQFLEENIKTKKLFNKSDIGRLMKPTQQWLSRSCDQNSYENQLCDIENVKKLRIPNWRSCL